MALFQGDIATPEAPETLHATARRLVFLVLLTGAVIHSAQAQSQQWRIASEKDGIRLETRALPGQRFDELRVSTSLKASPQTIADYLFGKYLDERNRNITRSFIKRERDTAIWADVLRAPMISERCYSMRFDKLIHGNGEIRVRFVSLEYAGMEPKPGCIALRSRGEWLITPTGTGTRLTYVSLTDVGGRVPVALARRSMSAAAVMSVRKVVAGASGLALPRGIGD